MPIYAKESHSELPNWFFAFLYENADPLNYTVALLNWLNYPPFDPWIRFTAGCTIVVVKNWPSSRCWHMFMQLKASHWDIHNPRPVPMPPSFHILPESLQTAPKSTFIPKILPPRKLCWLKSSRSNLQPRRLYSSRANCIPHPPDSNPEVSDNDHRDVHLQLLLFFLVHIYNV